MTTIQSPQLTHTSPTADALFSSPAPSGPPTPSPNKTAHPSPSGTAAAAKAHGAGGVRGGKGVGGGLRFSFDIPPPPSATATATMARVGKGKSPVKSGYGGYSGREPKDRTAGIGIRMGKVPGKIRGSQKGAQKEKERGFGIPKNANTNRQLPAGVKERYPVEDSAHEKEKGKEKQGKGMGLGEADLVNALLERKRALENEVGKLRGVKRGLEEDLEGERAEEEERKKSRVEGDAGRDILGSGGEGLGGRDVGELVKALLMTNDASLLGETILPAPSVAQHVGTQTMDGRVGAGRIEKKSEEEDEIPSVRPLYLTKQLSAKTLMTWAPFVVTKHVSVLMSPPPPSTLTEVGRDVEVEAGLDTGKRIFHTTLAGHMPDKLLFFRVEFDVSIPIPGVQRSIDGQSDKGVGEVDAVPQVEKITCTSVSSWSRRELLPALEKMRRRRDVLSVLVAVGGYVKVAARRAEAWRTLSREYSAGNRTGIVMRGVSVGAGSAGVKRSQGRRTGGRWDTLPWLGEDTVEFVSEGRKEGEGRVLIQWKIWVEEGTGEVGSEVEAEVAVGGGTAGRKRGELVRETGVLGAVRAVVGVVFGVSGEIRRVGRREAEESEVEVE
ncbi:hypothetical protein BDZ91DRAFT_848907 [Kalaharituber pfeilii]|nr:hypothetical protein BDZ91DRAFT_848907 [Kalaharituber pfeilii]